MKLLRQPKTWFVVSALALAAIGVQQKMCASPWPEHDGAIRQTAMIHASGLRRGGEGTVTVAATANYTRRDADVVQTTAVPELDSVSLTLVDSAGAATPLAVKKWSHSHGQASAQLALPEVPDGDYKLRASYRTTLGAGEVEAALPLYTPARVHVITDRPLYEPGNLVRFRAVVLRARDLVPLDKRPGMWVVRDPNNEVLLEEKAAAGDWGVVSGTFPIDKGAQVGSWRVAWVSADATDEVAFTVEPFTLPRFRVDASTPLPYYRPGDSPAIRGAVLYSSGAPVANANLEIQWFVASEQGWPPPPAWMESQLPKTAVTKPNGRFELALPQVPGDVRGVVTLSARIAAIDPAGDRATGQAAVVLSEDGILVSSVTELGDGLVQGFNNRLYVRVATPDGRPLPNTSIKVKRAWQPDDPGTTAEVDEDGVASMQIDPGPPVNVVIPAMPYRPTPRGATVTRGGVEELIGGEGPSLRDQVEMDRWLPSLAPCAKWYGATAPDADDDSGEGGGGDIRVGLRISGGGQVTFAGAGPSPLAQCAMSVLRGKRLPAGPERLYAIDFSFEDPGLPTLTASVEAALGLPEGLEERIANVAAGARDCLPRAADGGLGRALGWRVRAGQKAVELTGWVTDPNGGEAASALGCVTGRFAAARIALAEPAPTDALGLVRFGVEPAYSEEDEKPQPTVMLGYELIVHADVAGKAASAKLLVQPGAIPPLRMRVAPVLAKAGETITAELIRGPDFAGELPEELVLTHLKGHKTAKLAAGKAALTIDPGTEGWVEISGGGVRALVFVKPENDLQVAVKPTQDRYKPGDQAELLIETKIGGQGGQAAVGLFGVDDSLSQLVALPSATDLSRVRPEVGTSLPAFGTLDGQALTLGRIRGANAAAATVLRVTSIPTPPELDAVVTASGATRIDVIEELTDRFYVVLAELHVQARSWEASAPAAEKMKPATMAALWRKALAACKKRGERVDDAFGRELRLWRLPPDLLALTDPRAVIVVGTRLPEDVENWAAWVAKERP